METTIVISRHAAGTEFCKAWAVAHGYDVVAVLPHFDLSRVAQGGLTCWYEGGDLTDTDNPHLPLPGGKFGIGTERIDLQEVDMVIGVMPVPLVLWFAERGFKVRLLTLPELPAEKRGRELSVKEMAEAGAHLRLELDYYQLNERGERECRLVERKEEVAKACDLCGGVLDADRDCPACGASAENNGAGRS